MLTVHRSNRLKLVALSSVALLGLGACGGSEGDAPSGGGGGGGEQVDLVAVDNEFEPTELSLPAGAEVTVAFTNEGVAPHTFTSEELDVDTGSINGGESTTVTFTAPDGEVEFVCTIHAESDDMVGTIVPE